MAVASELAVDEVDGGVVVDAIVVVPIVLLLLLLAVFFPQSIFSYRLFTKTVDREGAAASKSELLSNEGEEDEDWKEPGENSSKSGKLPSTGKAGTSISSRKCPSPAVLPLAAKSPVVLDEPVMVLLMEVVRLPKRSFSVVIFLEEEEEEEDGGREGGEISCTANMA